MFWRKQRKAIGTFHPLHQALIWERGLSASLYPADWAQLIHSLAGHSALVRRRKWRPPDRATAVLVPLIRVLSEDMRPHGVLSIAADLRGHKVPEKSAGPAQQVPIPPGRERRRRGMGKTAGITKIMESRAYDPWLRLRAELRDGSVLDVVVADRVRLRRVSKVNPRGKHKTKHKTKITHVIGVTRRLPPNTPLRQPPTPPPPWIRVKMRQGHRTLIRSSAKLQQLNDANVAERVLFIAAEPFRWTPPGTIRPVSVKKTG